MEGVQRLATWRAAWRLYRQVLPAVDRELTGWRQRAGAIPDPDVRRQAQASIDHKRFHCEGGAVYALLAPPGRAEGLVRLIVAFQTISDYLDNLCDRAGPAPRRLLRRWHQAMLDALQPGARVPVDPTRWDVPDGGYLAELVGTCRRETARLPGLGRVLPDAWRLTRLYVDLQVLKHGPEHQRAPLLRGWARRHTALAPGLLWYEFAAAAGSTLGVFALLAAAAGGRPSPGAVRRLVSAYFPWVCALHILLDYWIDQEEDRLGGDLNFASCYPSQQEAAARLGALFDHAVGAAGALPQGALHATIVRGLPALYFSDAKARRGPLRGLAGEVLRRGGWRTRLIHACCRLRRLGDPQDGRLQPPPDPASFLTPARPGSYNEGTGYEQVFERLGPRGAGAEFSTRPRQDGGQPG